MKSELIGTKETKKEIDWSKSQLVIITFEDLKCIVLTTGKHGDKYFEGVIVWSEHPEFVTGQYYSELTKSVYILLPPSQVIKLQND